MNIVQEDVMHILYKELLINLYNMHNSPDKSKEVTNNFFTTNLWREK